MSVAQAQNRLRAAIDLHQRGDLDAAAGVYAEILQGNPQLADAWHLSGLVAYQRGDLDDAEQLIRHALKLTPRQSDYLSNLAAVLLKADRVEEAEEAARSAIDLGPVANKSRKHLATALSRQGQLGDGISILEQVIGEDPLDADAHCNLGAMLHESKRFDDAVAILDTAIALNTQSFQARLNLGGALRGCRQLERSLAELEIAVQLGPQIPQCYVNRGNTRLDLLDAKGALDDFQQAIQLEPNSALALHGLGRTLQQFGQWELALDALDQACRLDGPLSRFESNRLYGASLAPHLSRTQMFDLHADWGHRIEEHTTVLPPVTYNHERMRIGYVSPDFRNHATMRFVAPLLEGHNRSRAELYCYSEGHFDAVSERIQQVCTGWRATTQLNDEELSDQIRSDEIDVLVDLAGHTAHNRLPVFAAKPATVQVSFLGYPNTTGLSRIDYFLTDAVREPRDAQSFYTEELIYLPHGACCFEASSAPDITELPSLAVGHVTFGSTHRPEKISPECMQLWAQVLERVPDSRLVMIRDSFTSQQTRDVLNQQLLTAGIDGAQVEFRWQLPKEFLEIYSDIDILLDVFPWGSGTTAYECMWMGVPIPTISGDRGSCRATASMMHVLEVDELIASTPDEYVRLTAELAGDRPRLQELRRSLRPMMQRSVCDARAFAGDVEQAFTDMLERAARENTQRTSKLPSQERSQ